MLFAIALPLTFQLAYNHQAPHDVPVAVVGSDNQVRMVADEVRHVVASGLDVRQSSSVAAAIAAVKDRKVAAAYVPSGPIGTVYVARAASAIRANFLEGVFTRLAVASGRPAPRLVDVVPLASRDSGTGIFFFVFPLMMVGLIAAILLVQVPAWRIGRRVTAVAAVGAVGALASYFVPVGLHVLPGKPLLLVYAFLLTQVYGQLMVGAAPLLKQYFLPVSLTFALILSVPSSGGTVTPDLRPAFYRDLSQALPLAQLVTVTRGVAYFRNNGIGQGTLVLGLWAGATAAVVALAWLRQARSQRADPPIARRNRLRHVARTLNGQPSATTNQL